MRILKAGRNEMGFVSSPSCRRNGMTARAEIQRARGVPHRRAAERIATCLRGAEKSRGPTRALRRFSFPLVSLSRAAYGVRFVQERKLLRFPSLDGTIMKIDSETSHANAECSESLKFKPRYVFSPEI